MARPSILYQKPLSLIQIDITLDQLRIELSQRIHSLHNRRSTDAFMDMALCYFDPGLIYQVAIGLVPDLHPGDDPEFTRQRQRVIASVVEMLKQVGAVEEVLLKSADHYCWLFRLCIGRGCTTPAFRNLWLTPLRPEFFWGNVHEGVADLSQVVYRRRLTGLAALKWVPPLNGKGGRP